MCGPLGIFNSYVSLIQIKIFLGTIRRISSPTNLAVTSWAFSCGDGRHNDGKSQQGDGKHNDGDGRYDNAA